MALADHEAKFGHPLRDRYPVDCETGEFLPVLTLVTDWGTSRPAPGKGEAVRSGR